MQDILGRLSSMLFANEYVVTVIEDEEQVALAAGIPGSVSSTPLFTLTVIVMMAIVLFVAAAFYLLQCRQIQKRIDEMVNISNARKGHYNSWNIKSLKEECTRLEFLASDQLAEESLRLS